MTSNQHLPRRGRRPSSSSSSVGLLAGLLLLATATGCPSPDAEGKYDLFIDQTEDERDLPETKMDFGAPMLPDFGSGGETETGGAPSFDGIYLVAVDTIVSYGLPLQFIGVMTADLDAEGNGMVSVDFQPLALEPMGTLAGEEVGEAITRDATVESYAFTLDFGQVMVTGAANPITGSDITATLSLVGQIRNEDAWCGTVTGMVESPIMVPLEGSFFAATRLADREERLAKFPCDCGAVGAEPGPMDGCYPRM